MKLLSANILKPFTNVADKYAYGNNSATRRLKMNINGMGPQIQPMQNQWTEEARETPPAKRAEELKGETVTKQVQPQTTQAPMAAGDTSAEKGAEKPKGENPSFGGIDVYA
jgi:dissimilatory sulfite reductase (desulfoviridin) alpha/beta subunit